MSVKIRDIDKGWKKIKKDVATLKGSYTKVGIQSGDKAKDRNENGIITTSDLDLATIAAWQEFGARRIPSRPFMRNTFDKNESELSRIKIRQYSQIISNRQSVAAALALIGTWFEDKMKKEITDLKTPPNAPRTILQKGSSNPLIDTGTLRASIRHVEVLS